MWDDLRQGEQARSPSVHQCILYRCLLSIIAIPLNLHDAKKSFRVYLALLKSSNERDNILEKHNKAMRLNRYKLLFLFAEFWLRGEDLNL